MTLKIKTLIFFNFPQVTSALKYNRTSSIALMYRAYRVLVYYYF